MTRSNLGRALRSAAAAAALVIAVAACGGGKSDSVRATDALTGLYVIDHDGASPSGADLAPYQASFVVLRRSCTGSPEDLASALQDIATKASNGSGTTITSLQAMRAVVRYLQQNP